MLPQAKEDCAPNENKANRPSAWYLVRKSTAAVFKYPPFCDNCSPEFQTFPSHIEHWRPGNKLLRDACRMCEALAHVIKCPEFGISEHCSINGSSYDDCRPQAVSLIASIGTFLGRYTNCRRKHAEQIMSQDDKLQSYLLEIQKTRSTLPLTFTIYIKFQPCHHSGGNASKFSNSYMFDGHADARSCTHVLLHFYHRWLKPINCALKIVIAGLYKANWRNRRMREDDKNTVLNARRGIRLLLEYNKKAHPKERGIFIEAMKTNDWAFLASLAKDVTYEMFQWPPRLQNDSETQKFLDELARTSNEDDLLYFEKEEQEKLEPKKYKRFLTTGDSSDDDKEEKKTAKKSKTQSSDRSTAMPAPVTPLVSPAMTPPMTTTSLITTTTTAAAASSVEEEEDLHTWLFQAMLSKKKKDEESTAKNTSDEAVSLSSSALLSSSEEDRTSETELDSEDQETTRTVLLSTSLLEEKEQVENLEQVETNICQKQTEKEEEIREEKKDDDDDNSLEHFVPDSREVVNSCEVMDKNNVLQNCLASFPPLEAKSNNHDAKIKSPLLANYLFGKKSAS